MSGEREITSTCINEETIYDDDDASKYLDPPPRSCKLENFRDDTGTNGLATLTKRETERQFSSIVTVRRQAK